MPENNQILSVAGQLVGIPLQEYTAGPGIVVDNVNKTISVGITWEDVTSQVTVNTSLVTSGSMSFYYCKALKLISIIGEVLIVGGGTLYTLPEKYRPVKGFTLPNPNGQYFIDYVANSGQFNARAGYYSYNSMYLTLPCQGE